MNKKVYLILIILLVDMFSAYAFSSEREHIIIEGKINKDDILYKSIEKLNQNVNKLNSKLNLLQDNLNSKYTDLVHLNITLQKSNKNNTIQYEVIQFLGKMNNFSLIRYDDPIFFGAEQEFPIYKGILPLGDYEFRINATLGQRLDQSSLVFSEKKWEIEKNLIIKAHLASEKRNIKLVLAENKKTGLPELNEEKLIK